MKLSQIIRTILSLLGIYTIFVTIVSAGMSVILIPVTMIFQGMGSVGFPILMVLFQFLLPLTVGILVVWQNKRLANWVLTFSGFDADREAEHLEIKEFPLVAFSLLGLYMLSRTIPGMCQFIAYLFQMKIEESSYMVSAGGRFLENHLQDIVYHAIAVGFSLLVFMKGKSFGKLALSLKKRGRPVEAGNG